MSQRPELRALTSVRGIAAWWVVLYHIRASIGGLPDAIERGLARGYLAVDFFFLLSGFVIWMSYGERLRATGLAGVPDFLKRRVARIWPLHLFMLACAVALALLLAATGHPDPAAFPFAELPLHLMLVQNWGFTDHLAWNDPAWSISAELGAYLAFPLLVSRVDWRRLPTPALIGTMVALLLLLDRVMTGGGATSLGDAIPRWGLVRCLFEFATGTIVCALWMRWRTRGKGPTIASGTAVLGAALLWGMGMRETLVVPAGFAALLLFLALTCGRRGNPLEGRALHSLGEVSYATYLGHFLLWKLFKLIAVSDAAAVSPARIALYLMLVLAASYALYHLIERPAQRAINRWHWRARQPATSAGAEA